MPPTKVARAEVGSAPISTSDHHKTLGGSLFSFHAASANYDPKTGPSNSQSAVPEQRPGSLEVETHRRDTSQLGPENLGRCLSKKVPTGHDQRREALERSV